MEDPIQRRCEYKSKNLAAERRRRSKLNERLYALRALVPNITKMSKPSILVDAFDYMKQLQRQVKELQDELMELPDGEEEKHEIAVSKSQKLEKCEVEVVVTPVDANKLDIKIVCEKREHGFSQLMEAINHLGLEVISINFTSFKGVALNALCVEGRERVKYDGDQLKEWLLNFV